MSKSLALENGDLAIFGRGYAVVEGSAKLAQDLRLWVLERIGSDPATPTYGSSLDGGTINGVEVPSLVGQQMTNSNVLTIQSIVSNLLQQYQQGQLTKMQAEIVQYGGKTTLSNDEVIYTVDGVSATALGTTVVVQASITTLSGQTLLLTIPLAV